MTRSSRLVAAKRFTVADSWRRRLSSLCRCVVFVGGLFTIIAAMPLHADEPEAKKPAQQVRLDVNGEPLPPSALGRIGGERFRNAGSVVALAYRDQGKTIVSVADDGEIRFWDAKTGITQHIARIKGASAYSVLFAAIDPTGSRAAVRVGSSIALYDLWRGEAVREWDGPDLMISALALSSDGKTLFSGNRDNTAQLWNLTTGEKIREFKEHEHEVIAAAFSPDGNMIATGEDFGDLDGAPPPPKNLKCVLRLWDTKTGKVSHRVEGLQGSPYGMRFSPDGSKLVFAVRNTLLLWDVQKNQELRKLANIEGSSATPAWGQFTFSADGKWLAAITFSAIALWDLTTSKEPRFMPANMVLHQNRNGWGGTMEPAQPLKLCFSPDGSLLAAAMRSDHRHRIHVYDVTTLKDVSPATAGHELPIEQVFLTRDGKQAVTWSKDKTLRVWDVTNCKEISQWSFPDTPIERILLSPDDRTVAVTIRAVIRDDRRKCVIELRDLRTGKVRATLVAPEKNIFGFSFSADGKWLASSGDALHLWDMVLAKERPLPARIPESMQAVCLTPDGTAFATVERPPQTSKLEAPGRQGALMQVPIQQIPIHIWNADTGKVQTTLPGVFGPRNECLSFSADGGTLVSGGGADVIRVWDVERARERCLIPRVGKSQIVRSVALTPDGRVVAVADDRSTAIRVYETATGQPIGVLAGHQGEVLSLAVSGAGTVLASTGADRSILFWDLRVPLGMERTSLKEPTKHEIEQCWANLESPNAALAFKAVCVLARNPQRSIPFLKENLKPVPMQDKKRLQRLIAALDADDFPTRQTARNELERIGAVAEAELRQALKETQSAEVRKQAQELLQAFDSSKPTSAALRELRAIQVLEYIGEKEGKALLDTLAKGEPTATCTKEAVKALRRLKMQNEK